MNDDSIEIKSWDDDNSIELTDSSECESGDMMTIQPIQQRVRPMPAPLRIFGMIWMILEVYKTENYETKVSEYVMNGYQNAEEYAKCDMLEVHKNYLKFNYCKILLTYNRMLG